MCGIAGFVGTGTRADLERMLDGIRHRGPDDSGTFWDGGIGLAHARLSIIDPSSAGHQPMWNRDRSVVIVFNGEIYNFKTLRDDLKKQGRVFTTNTDTEVILHLYDVYGEQCFEKIDGMFAIALCDLVQHKLLLARDRMGEKPLYWSLQSGSFLFASELGVLMAHPTVVREIDLNALNMYLLLDYVPTPHTILKNVQKLEPGTVLVYEKGAVRTRTFWQFPEQVTAGSVADAVARLDRVLEKNVADQLVSDVPLGVFLSGGIDSSTIAWYAGRASSVPINTFSIAFEDAEFDESVHAREVSELLGTRHHERVVTAADALALVKKIPDVCSEPVADASVIPTMLLSEFARRTVTVSVGGDGGDELFAGYPTFFAERVFALYQNVPQIVRRVIARVIDMFPAGDGNLGLAFLLKKFVSSSHVDAARRHMEWLGSFPEAARRDLAAGQLVSVVQTSNVFEDTDRHAAAYTQGDVGNKLLAVYARSYLMDQVLVKVDRASMHYALETRAPFLGREVVECVFSLPYAFKYRGFTTKYLLKKLMRGRLPDHILDRKKKGFGIPLARWLKHDLRGLCDELLSEKSLAAHGLFNVGYVTKLKTDHMSGAADNRKQLWNLMVFQMWYNRWMK